MAVVAHNQKEVDLLARLMRAEAEEDGQMGMLMVGNVGVNRVLADCLDFTDINTIERMVYQRPGGFESTMYSYFYQPARSIDKRLAKRVLNGERFFPASYALYFYAAGTEGCRSQWFGQWNTGRFKAHCFYAPARSEGCY